MRKNLTTEEYIKQAEKTHGKTYDYSKVIYTKKKDRVIIICKIHGEFIQIADNHVRKAGCPHCKADNSRISLKEFIKRSNIIHNHKYTYLKTNYFRSDRKVIITCPIHGDFKQVPNSHLAGKGCYDCGFENHSGSYGSIFKHNPNFELFLYFIRCSKEGEVFYKIGLTKDVKQRLWDIPYKKEVLLSKKGKISDLYPIEQNIIRKFKIYKYIPDTLFSGKNECFKPQKDINMLDDILTAYPYLSY